MLWDPGIALLAAFETKPWIPCRIGVEVALGIESSRL
jgi:hypothetical protein